MDMADSFGKTLDLARKKFNSPTFCFFHAKPIMKIADIRQVIKDGGTFNLVDRSSGRRPVCPFA